MCSIVDLESPLIFSNKMSGFSSIYIAYIEDPVKYQDEMLILSVVDL